MRGFDFPPRWFFRLWFAFCVFVALVVLSIVVTIGVLLCIKLWP